MIHSAIRTTIDVAKLVNCIKMNWITDLQANLRQYNLKSYTNQMKCNLFQTYCTNGCSILQRVASGSYLLATIVYYSVFLVFQKRCSVSKMFASRGIPTFAEQPHNSFYRFAYRFQHSCTCLSPFMCNLLPIGKWWNSVLYRSCVLGCVFHYYKSVLVARCSFH